MIYLGILLTTIFATGQDTYSQIVMPRAGVAISQTTHTPVSPPGRVHSKVGACIGLGAQFQLVRELRFQVECNYVSKGYESIAGTKTSATQSSYESVIKHDYLEFPIVIKKYWGNSPFQFYVSAGGYAAVGIGGTARHKSWSYSQGMLTRYSDSEGSIRYGADNSNNADIYYDKRVDGGVTIGAGVIILGKVGLDIRYAAGLIDIDDSYKNFKNRTVQAVVFIPLNVGRSD